MRTLITHPTGNEFFRYAAKGFYEAGMLQSLYTEIASFPGTLSYGLGSLKIFYDIRRRALDARFKDVVYTHPWKETGRLLAMKAGMKKLVAHETGIFCVDEVYKDLDQYVAKNLAKEKRKGLNAVYAYEDGAAFSFRQARTLGLTCIYDLPIGYWRAMRCMLSKEKELNPKWAITLGGFKDSTEKLNRKDEEISLADTIIVASSFTSKTLAQYPGTLPKVQVVPYGFPLAKEKQYRSFTGNQKLKVLFVGGLSQRKGLSYLFKAINDLGAHVCLTIVGRGGVDDCKPLAENIRKHTWIETLPHTKVLELMCEHDILIFPSLFEGFGQVITEAMARGTPVITTDRTAGADIIKHGENGWLVSAGCAGAISNALEQILLRPQVIADVGAAAVETAKKRPWDVYGRELAEAIGKSESL
jgi:glycosyltransferase involved in cell wall biosynthesis